MTRLVIQGNQIFKKKNEEKQKFQDRSLNKLKTLF